jgi:hypothetical protein
LLRHFDVGATTRLLQKQIHAAEIDDGVAVIKQVHSENADDRRSAALRRKLKNKALQQL